MTDDIVTRLRNVPEKIIRMSGSEMNPYYNRCQEAAGEIERLRRELYMAEKWRDNYKLALERATGKAVSVTIILKHELQWLSSLETLAITFSTCSKRQYAAVVLSPNKRVIGFGYNGSPSGMPHCNEGHCPRLHEDAASGSNYDTCIAQHAEAGALLWCDPAQRQGATLVVNGPPCMGCAKLIASSGISRIVYKADSSYIQWADVEKFLIAAGVEVVGYGNKPFGMLPLFG